MSRGVHPPTPDGVGMTKLLNLTPMEPAPMKMGDDNIYASESYQRVYVGAICDWGDGGGGVGNGRFP